MHLAIRLLLFIFVTSCSSPEDTTKFYSIPREKADSVDLEEQTTEKKLLMSGVDREKTDFVDLKEQTTAKNSVVLLLPMSGANKAIGRNILNACILANKNSDVDFYVIDTLNCPDDLRQGLFCNLKFAVGPVFFKEIHKFASIFQDVPVLALSNNTDIDNNRVYACGLSPKEEIKAIFDYIKRNGIESVVVLLPEGEFFRNILNFIRKEANDSGIDEENINVIKCDGMPSESAIELVEANPGKAVFLFKPFVHAKQLTDTPLFTLSSLALSDPSKWDGVMFAYSDNVMQDNFIKNYQEIFGESPTVISLVAHDLIKALNESLSSGETIFDKPFQGTLGIFRIVKGKGLSRNLEILRIENKAKTKVEGDIKGRHSIKKMIHFKYCS